MSVVDGNALAGPLADVLGVDPTTATLRCAGCGALRMVAFARVVRTAMGIVARCADCDTVLVTVVEDGGRRWVGMPGVRAVQLG
jgi:hypothetical protein